MMSCLSGCSCNLNSYRSTWSPINLLWKLPINFAGCSEMQDAHLSCNFLWPASWLGLFLPFNCFLLEFPLLIVWLFYQQIPISYFCDVKSAWLSALFTITRIYEKLLVNNGTCTVMSYLLLTFAYGKFVLPCAIWNIYCSRMIGLCVCVIFAFSEAD